MIRELWRKAKPHPRVVLAVVPLGACATMKLLVTAGGGTLLTFLRDAGRQFSGKCLLGPLGAADAAAFNYPIKWWDKSIWNRPNSSHTPTATPRTQAGHGLQWSPQAACHQIEN